MNAVLDFLFRSTPPSQPNKVGLKCPSVRPSVYKKFLRFGMQVEVDD